MEDEKKMRSEELPGEVDNSLSVDDEPLDPGTTLEEIEFIPLDSLLYEYIEASFESSYSEQADGFESFFAEYRELIAESFVAARKMKAEDEAPSGDDKPIGKTLEAAEDIPIAAAVESVKKQSDKKKAKPATTHEGDNITLKPEEYEPLETKEEIFREEPVVEEHYDLLLGAETDEQEDEEPEENVQISFFTETRPKVTDDDEEDEVEEYDPENPRIIDTVFDFLELFIFTLVAVMVLTTFLFRHSVVEGDSMNNTLEDGDHLIIWDAFYTPDRYDIIVFEDYSTSLKKAVVKRVIGLPGETVEIKKNSDGSFAVYVDGEYIEEDYAYHDIRYFSPNTGVWTLGEDEIFVMGDNRYNSTDSRDAGVGPINIDSVLGKVVLRFFPFNKFGAFN